MTIRRIFSQLLVIASVLAGAGLVHGQLPTGDPRSFSVTPVPGSRAKLYLVGEVETLGRFAGESRHDVNPQTYDGGKELALMVAGQLGLMRNLSARQALGITGYFGGSGDSWRIGLAPRYSHWFGSAVHVSVEPVLLLAGGNSKSEVTYPALGGHIGVMFTSWLGLSLRTEVIDHTFNQVYQGAPTGVTWTEKSWYGGLTLGGYPGLAVAGAALMLVGLAAAAAHSTV
jgi:hypothetical protein